MNEGKRLLLLLRAEQPEAQQRVLAALQENGGNVSATARALGVSAESLYLLAPRGTAYGDAFRAACQGMTGAQRAAVAARRLRAAEKARARAAELEALAGGDAPG